MPGRVVLALILIGCAPTRPERPTSRFDLDGDGRAELLALQSWDGAIVEIGSAGAIERAVWTLAPDESAIRVADMNGDGRGELVVWRGERARLSIHRGAPEHTFEAAPWLEAEVGRIRNVRRAGDLDGDGLADLVAVGFGAPSTILFGDPDVPRLGPIIELGGEAVAELDLDGDGRSDLVAEDDGVFQLYLGGTDAMREVEPPLPGLVAIGAMVDPAAPSRDLLATASGSGTAFLLRWTGNEFALTEHTPGGLPVDRGQLLGDPTWDDVLFVGSGWAVGGAEGVVLPLDDVGTPAVIGDLDGDGFDELGSPVRTPDGATGLRVRFGGLAMLREGFVVVPPEVDGSTPLHGGFAAGADLDGDGRADYAVIDEDEHCLQILWGAPRSPELVTQRLCQADAVTGATLRGLGEQDDAPGDELLWGDRVMRIDRTGLVTLARASPTLTPVGDVNGDGFMDLVQSGELVLGGDNVASGTLARTTLPGLAQATYLGDVNGDGIDDLGVGGDVHFGGPDVATSTPGIVGIGFLGVGDQDGDGRAELGVLLRSERPFVDVLSIQLWDGMGLSEIARWDVTLPFRRCGDLDGDGREELASWDTVWSGGAVMPAAGDCPGDLDGDGLDDFVHSNDGYLVSWGARPFVVEEWSIVRRPLTRADLALTPVW